MKKKQYLCSRAEYERGVKRKYLVHFFPLDDLLKLCFPSDDLLKLCMLKHEII